MATVNECFVKIKQFIGEEGSVDDQKILDVLNDLAERRKVLGDEQFLKLVGQTRKAIEERNVNIEKQKAVTLQRYVENKKRFASIKNQGGTTSDMVASIFAGTTKKFENSQRNVGGTLSNIRAQYHGAIEAAVNASDAQNLVKTPEFSKDLRIEMHEVANKGTPGKSGNPVAQKLAKSLIAVYNKQRVDLTSVGYSFGELKNYMGWQHWDKTKLSKIDKNEWVADFTKYLNRELSLEPGEDITKRALEAYDSITNGTSSSYLQARSLHFKDGEAVDAMLAKYGTFPNAIESIFQQSDSVSRRLALAEFLGPDIKRGAELVDKFIEKSGGFGNVAENSFNRASNYVDFFSGALSGNNDAAFLGAAWRSFQQATKLGGAAVTAAIGDIFSASANFRSQAGGSALDATQKIWSNYLKVVTNKSDQIAMANELHTFANSLAAAFNLENGGIFPGAAPGNMARFASTMFRWTGMERHNNAMKTAIATSAASNMAKYARQGWANLPSNVMKNLKAYGITEAEFSSFNQALVELPWGDMVVSPKRMLDIGGPYVETSKKLGNFYNDLAAQTVLDGSAYVKGIGHQGTQGGTFMGEMIRMFYQFKSAPIQQATNMKSMYHLYGGGLQGGLAVAQAAAAYTLAGYMIYSAKEVLSNRSPPSPTDPNTWITAAQRGGAAGIYTDFMLAEYNKSYKNFAIDLLGPTVADVNKFAKVAASLAYDNEPSDQVDALKFMARSIPGNNMWMVAPVFHGLFMQSMYENIKPGTTIKEQFRLESQGRTKLIEGM